MHFIGRMTIPIMCFFIAQGYLRTSNLKKYALRLLIFALIAHIPFVMWQTGGFPLTIVGFLQSFFNTSVMWPLFLGLIALHIINKRHWNYFLRLFFIVVFLVLSFAGDWTIWAVLWIIVFGTLHKHKVWQFVCFAGIALVYILLHIVSPAVAGETWAWHLYTLGLFAPILLLWFYNGSRKPSKHLKYAFYIFYPAHLLIIAVIALLV